MSFSCFFSFLALPARPPSAGCLVHCPQGGGCLFLGRLSAEGNRGCFLPQLLDQAPPPSPRQHTHAPPPTGNQLSSVVWWELHPTGRSVLDVAEMFSQRGQVATPKALGHCSNSACLAWAGEAAPRWATPLALMDPHCQRHIPSLQRQTAGGHPGPRVEMQSWWERRARP